MRAPLSWLRDYAPLDAGVDDLASRLSELGLVVDGVEHVGAGIGDVMVARVLGIRAHPDADRIRLVDVDAGGDALQIVCGAWNFEVGDLVPLAPVGAVLPGGFTISRRKMRGQWSNGMLCSPEELELPVPAGAADGLLVLPPALAAPGTPLTDALGLQPDVVFDLDVSPNRPDALSIAGVARDLAAALGERWSHPAGLPAGPPPVAIDPSVGTAPVTLKAGDLCSRFAATILEGVPEGPSPAWMSRRLVLAGMRPISAVVDVSNYVMLDLGQPNHAYDLDRLGGGGILVRRGNPGEVLETLDGVSRSLGPEDCVICDAAGTPVGLGGVMGGASAEIAGGTRRVLLEAAWFNPLAIARTGIRLGLHSEARVRFERGVDPALAPAATERFVALLASVAGAGSALRRGPTVDAVDSASLPTSPSVRVRTSRVNSILGTALGDADVARLLAPIGFDATPESPGVFSVRVPTWRLESGREIDVVEEVARMWGYRRIERTLPGGTRAGAGGLTFRQRERRLVRDVMVGAGFDEAWTTTFLAPGDLERAGLGDLGAGAVEVENPLDRSESILRAALLPGLLKAARSNADRQAPGVRLFEIGHVFGPPPAGRATPDEPEHLGAIVTGARPGDGAAAASEAVRAWLSLAGALRLDGCRMQAATVPGLHPGRAVCLVGASGASLGSLGEVDPEVLAAYGLQQRVGYLAVSLDAVATFPRRGWQAHDVSRFPASDFDLAFAVGDEVAAGEVLSTLAAAGGELLEGATLFDVYRGEQVGPGRRSLAFRLRLRAADRTLGEEELAEVRRRAVAAVSEAHGGELRG
ncbi:MAG: phenylalanine--tRNA ligase subunit beta [Acidimicrobiales bacterium]